MPEKEFEREVLDRLITVETLLKTLTVQCPQCQAKLITHGEEIVSLTASTKSAHHRIDGIYQAAGIVAAIISTVVGGIFTIVNFVLHGGHG